MSEAAFGVGVGGFGCADGGGSGGSSPAILLGGRYVTNTGFVCTIPDLDTPFLINLYPRFV